MRTAEITLAGKTYPLCFSLRSLYAFCDRYGSMNGALQKPAEANESGGTQGMVEEYLWQLLQLMKDGKKHAEMVEAHTEDIPELETLYDLLGIEDLTNIQLKIVEAVNASIGREIGAEPPKNAGATRASEST